MARPKREIPWLDWRNDVAYVFWYDAERRETKRQSLGTKDPAEAQARFAAFLVEGRAITHPGGAPGLTVAQALDDYWREHGSGVTDAVRQEQAIRYLKAFFGDSLLSDVNIPRSRAYIEARRADAVAIPRQKSGRRGNSDATIRRELTVLVAAGNHAVRWERAPRGVLVELPRLTVVDEDQEQPYYTKAELDMLFQMSDGELHAFVVLAYYTGARRDSIEGLTRSQINWDQKRITLRRTGQRITKKRRPIVPIFPEMEPVLKDLWATGRERLFAAQQLYRPYRRLCETLGLADKHHPHLLRHTRATHLLQDGVSIYTVARLLGDSVKTVEKVYGHHSHEYVAKEILEKG